MWSIIPSYLIILIIIFVIVPSILALGLRMALYYHLVNQGNQIKRLIYTQFSGKKPRLVEYLENRLALASQELETVNTAALIDQVYSQERVGFIACEQIDYLCRILPNLLLAFGLLGTFVGITINLASLSQTVSATNVNDISSLLTQIQEPLRGMGIAFSTSLTAILFSAFLIVVNFLFNTHLAKYRLLSALEDYLDNIYRPTLGGQTRLDRVVQSMVNSFDQFLIRFGHGIQESVESALKEKVEAIHQANLKSTQLAEQVYSRLMDASVTVTQSAKDFQIAGDRFLEVAQVFERNQFPQLLSNATVDLANTQRSFSQSAIQLATSIQSVELTGIELQNYSKRLIRFGEQVQQSQQKSIELLESSQKNQQVFSELTSQVQTASQNFQLAANTLDTLQRRWVTKTDHLEEIQTELSQLLLAMNTYTEGVKTAMEKLSDRLTANLNSNSPVNSLSVQPITDNLQECVNYLKETKHEIYRLRYTLEKK